MEQGHIDRIVGCYGSAGEFKINKKYSRPHETVYTKDGDKYHWLVVEQKGFGNAEVRQTDEHGKITAWDTYESSGGAVRFGVDEIKTIREAVSSGTGCQFPESIEGRLSVLSSEVRKGFLATAAAHGIPKQRQSVLKRMAEIKARRGNLETSGEKRQKKAERDAVTL